MGEVRKWVNAIDEYEVWLRSESKSERTITQRRYQLGLLAEDHARSPWRLTTVHLYQWLASYEWSPSTRASYVATLRSFYFWAAEIAGHVKKNPTTKLKAPSIPKGVPRPAPDVIADGAMERGSERDRLIILLTELAGLRRAEVASLRWEHIDAENIYIHEGKGRKSRTIPLDAALKDALDTESERRSHGEYAAGFRYKPASDSGWVFPSRNGRHLTPHTIGTVASAALGPGWTHHTLRHRFGTTAYQESGDLRIVSELMGHSRMDTTAGYARLPGDAHRRVIDGIGRRRRSTDEGTTS